MKQWPIGGLPVNHNRVIYVLMKKKKRASQRGDGTFVMKDTLYLAGYPDLQKLRTPSGTIPPFFRDLHLNLWRLPCMSAKIQQPPLVTTRVFLAQHGKKKIVQLRLLQTRGDEGWTCELGRKLCYCTHLWKILDFLSLEKFSSCKDSWVRKATAKWK